MPDLKWFLVTTLPGIIFFVALVQLLFYNGVLQWCIEKFAVFFFWSMVRPQLILSLEKCARAIGPRYTRYSFVSEAAISLFQGPLPSHLNLKDIAHQPLR